MQSNWNKLKRKLSDDKQKKDIIRKKRRRFDHRPSPHINTTTDDNTPSQQSDMPPDTKSNSKMISNQQRKIAKNKSKNQSITEPKQSESAMVNPIMDELNIKALNPYLSIHKYLQSSPNDDAHNNTIDTNSSKSKMKAAVMTKDGFLELKPPPNCTQDYRQQFWNALRYALRKRLPEQFKLKLITHTPEDSRTHPITGQSTQVLALDCEMVGIGQNGSKSALARISIVNYDGDVVYDKFVKPLQKITDYRTHVSGVTPSDIKNLAIPFKQCLSEVVPLIKGRKLVGHALENDFKVLQCKSELKRTFYVMQQLHSDKKKGTKKKIRNIERYIRSIDDNGWTFDTAKCGLLHPNVLRPLGLKFLMELFLGVRIQGSEHDSVQDAVSAMALYRAVSPEVTHWVRENKKEKAEMRTEHQRIQTLRDVKRHERESEEEKRKIFNTYAYQSTFPDTSFMPTAGLNSSSTLQSIGSRVSLQSNPYHTMLFDEAKPTAMESAVTKIEDTKKSASVEKVDDFLDSD